MVHVRLCSLTGAEWDSSVEKAKNEFQDLCDSKFGKSDLLAQLLAKIDQARKMSALNVKQAALRAETRQTNERLAKAKSMQAAQALRDKKAAKEEEQNLAKAKAMRAIRACRAKKLSKGGPKEAEAEHEYWNRGRTRPRRSLKQLSAPFLANSAGPREIYRPNEWRHNRWFDSLVEGSDGGSDSEDEEDVEVHDGKETYFDVHKGLFDRGNQPGLDYELAAGPRPQIQSEYDEDFWALRTTNSWATADSKTG
jgi:hypothetical protein